MRWLLLLDDGDPHGLVEALVPDGVDMRHQFQPYGVSLVRLATDATVALHTWPEHERASLDCYGTAVERAPKVLEDLGWTALNTLVEDGWNSSPS